MQRVHTTQPYYFLGQFYDALYGAQHSIFRTLIEVSLIILNIINYM